MNAQLTVLKCTRLLRHAQLEKKVKDENVNKYNFKQYFKCFLLILI